MISQKMTDALNDQINKELYSAYLYMSMAAYAEDAGLPGTANWLGIQAKEEMTHAEKFYGYLNSQGARVVLGAIDAPPSDFESPEAVFQQVLEHEQKVTASINELVNLAGAEKDHASGIFLQWFVSEQVEEEESANEILSRFKLAGGAGGGLFMIDRELAARQFTPPAAEAE